MAANRSTLPENGVRLLQADELAAALAPTWGPTLLSELTHLPTGINSPSEAALELAPGTGSGPHHHGPAESLMVVISGTALVRWGAHLEHATTAGPGEFILIPPWMPHEETNAGADGVLRYQQLGETLTHIAMNLKPGTLC